MNRAFLFFFDRKAPARLSSTAVLGLEPQTPWGSMERYVEVLELGCEKKNYIFIFTYL
jgi:hypothetical protein